MPCGMFYGIKKAGWKMVRPCHKKQYRHQKNTFIYLKKSNFKGDLNPAMII